jgi:hypothetical protein
MNQQEIADLSADIIMRYYDNDVTPFLSSMDEDALWYGPAEGQFIRGRAKMFEAWDREEHDLTFTMGNLVVTHISGHPSTCEVMLAYTLVTHYPDGHELSVFQRLQLSWCMRFVVDAQGNRSRVPRILVCHISNPHAKHADDGFDFAPVRYATADLTLRSLSTSVTLISLNAIVLLRPSVIVAKFVFGQ